MSKIDTRSPAQLREAIRSGDTTITAEQLAAAEHRAEHERLLAEADELAAANAADAEREAKLAELRADIEHSQVDVERMRELARTASASIVGLVELARARRGELAEFAARARALSCPEASRGFPLEAGEVGWIKSSTGGGYSIRVGDRHFGSPNEWHLVDRVLADVRGELKLSEREPGTTNKVAPPSLDEQLAVLDRRPEPAPAPVAIRWTSGGMKIGQVASVSPAEAAHWIRRGVAEYVA